MAIASWISVHPKTLSAMTKKQASPEKAFDTVKFFREVKEKIARDTRDMSFTELKKHLNQRTLKKAS